MFFIPDLLCQSSFFGDLALLVTFLMFQIVSISNIFTIPYPFTFSYTPSFLSVEFLSSPHLSRSNFRITSRQSHPLLWPLLFLSYFPTPPPPSIPSSLPSPSFLLPSSTFTSRVISKHQPPAAVGIIGRVWLLQNQLASTDML